MTRIDNMLQNPTKVLKQVGALIVSHTQRNFRDQSFDGEPWEPRAPVNVYGILADFAAGKSRPPARRFQRSPVLEDTGRLAQSVTYEVTSTKTIRVGTNVPYAAVHQTGGAVESETITRELRERFWAWLKNEQPAIKRQLGWVLNKKFLDTKLQGEVPARPFLGVTKELSDAARKLVGVTIAEV